MDLNDATRASCVIAIAIGCTLEFADVLRGGEIGRDGGDC